MPTHQRLHFRNLLDQRVLDVYPPLYIQRDVKSVYKIFFQRKRNFIQYFHISRHVSIIYSIIFRYIQLLNRFESLKISLSPLSTRQSLLSSLHSSLQTHRQGSTTVVPVTEFWSSFSRSDTSRCSSRGRGAVSREAPKRCVCHEAFAA